MAKPVALYTAHQFLHTTKGSSQRKPRLPLRIPEPCHQLKRGGKILDLDEKELSEDDRITAEREGGILRGSDTTIEMILEEAYEALSLEPFRTLDVEQLLAEDWVYYGF